MSTPADLDPRTERYVQRFALKALVEACLVLEEGVATIKDIDLAMMAGAGIVPPPFARADAIGLDQVLADLERAQVEWGEDYEPPAILRRLVAQGRLGQKSGQGFFPYARPDAAFAQAPVSLESRGDFAIAWLANPPANSISPTVVEALSQVWLAVQSDPAIRALVIASSNPQIFCAGADIKAFTKMDAAGGRQLLDTTHDLFREFGRSSVVTIAAVNALALGGGCELAMACDIIIAAESAKFGQPEINLGIFPGAGGTQRLPRAVGKAKAMDLVLTARMMDAAEAERAGLVSRVVPNDKLLEEAMAAAQKIGEYSLPVAMMAKEAVNRAYEANLTEGILFERRLFHSAFALEDQKEGMAAFAEKRKPSFRHR